ncbi:MAG: nucleoside hydrolase [Desulfobacterales bacterium]
MNIILKFLLIIAVMVCPGISFSSNQGGKIPVIYSTDLFHPHDDPDDHFDIVTLYAMPEIDIRAIILDQGAKQEKRPGKIPIQQLNHLIGRDVPYEIGLSRPLRSPSDHALTEPEKYQKGVNLIIRVLRDSPKPVSIITVGSLRDVAAAFNRERELFKRKVKKLIIFIGDAQGAFKEYNVSLDPKAYSRIMNSGLPVYWVPSFDGGLWKNRGNASFWRANQAELLKNVSGSLANFFIYALLRKNENDPIRFLYRKVTDARKNKIMKGVRNLWCAAIFTFITDRKFIRRHDGWVALRPMELRDSEVSVKIFDFYPVSVFVDSNGRELLEKSARSRKIRRFKILKMDQYARAMTSVTNHLISEFGN